MKSTIKVLPWFDQNDTQDYFCLTWNITRKCNFKCSYCSYCDPSDNLFPELSDSEFDIITEWIFDNFKRDCKYTQITIFGGEPTLHQAQCKRAIRVSSLIATQVFLYTNLSGPLDFYQQMLSYHPNLHLTITFHEPQFPMNSFIEKIRKLKAYYHRINVIVTDADPSSLSLKEILTQDGLTVNYLKIIHCGNLHLHKQGSLKTGEHLIDGKQWNKYVNTHTNHFTGWTCLAGKNNLYVECNGDVFPCQGQSTSHHNKEKAAIPYFNIIKQPNALPPYQSTICPRKKCRLELYVSKYK